MLEAMVTKMYGYEWMTVGTMRLDGKSCSSCPVLRSKHVQDLISGRMLQARRCWSRASQVEACTLLTS